ncbi:MAG: FecR family protein [Gammaproteobacteria bacterium]|nr:FecR family protein [Gammaproteobacteria bacterium]MBU0787215.1 FecR family protein [Gammaproteobacteria bacterium]MBU0814222.1 FecR family protein [Gammaproteobacteria bacterium]MBU1786258.1 FecR family protein [Gammaproteobacteria bacterium]
MKLIAPGSSFIVCLFLCLSGGSALAEQTVAGFVTRIRGEVLVTADARQQRVALGNALHLGSRIATGTNARLEARMTDGTVLTLGEQTELTIEQVAGATPDSKNSLFEFLKGSFRAITRQPAANQTTRQWQVRTPVAIIGVRGTTLWGGFNLQNAGANTLDVVMIKGKGVYVENSGNVTELHLAGEGTTVTRTGAAPEPGKPWPMDKLQAAQKTIDW